MILTRQQLEELEDQALAPYGLRSKDSKGRAVLEDEPDYRTVFQRDRDRIPVSYTHLTPSIQQTQTT